MPRLRKRPAGVAKVGMTLAQYGRSECSLTIHLTPIERDILAILLAHDPDRPIGGNRIIELLWPNPDYEPDSASVYMKVLISNLRNKLIPIENDVRRGYYINRRTSLRPL